MNSIISKTFIFSFFLFTSVAFGQIAVSIGPTIIRENIFKDYKHSKLGSTGLYNYNSYALKCDYTQQRFRIYAELGYLNQGFNIESNWFSSSGGGSGAYHSEGKLWKSTVDLSYISYRIGMGHTFGIQTPRRGLWGQFIASIYCQYNHRLYYHESKQTMNRSISYDTLMGPGGDVTYTYPTDYTPFTHLKYVIDFFQIGVEATGRVGFNRFFGELSVSLNSYDRYRTDVVIDNGWYSSNGQMAPTSKLCLNIGFKVGAYLNVKLDEKKAVD
ncbi:MAG: hypothetical protein IT221_12940 [Fluviicola sp.]|nr:hypothetical protein [Fluviicola sp.]